MEILITLKGDEKTMVESFLRSLINEKISLKENMKISSEKSFIKVTQEEIYISVEPSAAANLVKNVTRLVEKIKNIFPSLISDKEEE
jgi:hypothetical protein